MKSLLAIFSLLLCQQLASGYRILGVFPLHGKSHFIIAQELMIGLAEKGHQVDVVSHFPMAKPIPNYHDISLKGSMPNVVNNLTFSEISYLRHDFFLYFFVEMVGNKICDLLELPQFQELLKNPPKNPPYDAVVVELFVSPCFLAFGRLLNVPIIGLTTTNFHDWLNYRIGNPHNTAVTSSVYAAHDRTLTFWERFINTVKVISSTAQIDYFTGAQNKHVKKYFGPDYPDVRDFSKEIALFLTNSHYTLNGVRPWNPSIKEIGGLHIRRKDDIPLSPQVESFINGTEHGFVYFTFGSMARFETFPVEMINAFYGAFRSIAPVKVLIKAAKPEMLPPGLPKNVLAQSWFPQITLLKHKKIKAFITHGGLMGTMESVAYGVPMVGVPLFGDQKLNLKNYVAKGVALSFETYEDVTEEQLTKYLTTVVKDPSFKKNAERLSKVFLDRPLSPMDEAVFWIEYVTRHGNILQNPLVRLNWWQRNLVDVYAVLLAIIVASVLAWLYTLRAIKNIFCSKSSKKSQKANLNEKKHK